MYRQNLNFDFMSKILGFIVGAVFGAFAHKARLWLGPDSNSYKRAFGSDFTWIVRRGDSRCQVS